jgi:hypothetical protein
MESWDLRRGEQFARTSATMDTQADPAFHVIDASIADLSVG